MEKNKKVLLIGGIVEGAILLFALVLSIIVWTTIAKGDDFPTKEALHQANIAKNGAFIAYFQNHTPFFFCVVCIPVFVIVAVDFVYFAIIASKRETNLSSQQLAAIKKKAEEEVRAEMMKEIEAEMLEKEPDQKQ